MNTWLPPTSDADDDIKVADELLHKADALLRRHKSLEESRTLSPQSSQPPPSPDQTPAPRPEPMLEEDLPILTEVIDDDELTVVTDIIPAFVPPPPVPQETIELAEALVRLDSDVARAVEGWFSNELPQLLTRELDKLSDRLQEEAIAHLRATLLPAISEKISRSLETPDDPEV